MDRGDKTLSPEEKAQRRKTSKRQDETNRKIAAHHARARRRRQDFCEQVSTTLAKNHRLVCFENLTVKAMTASAKGTVEEPGTNVSQKAGRLAATCFVGHSLTYEHVFDIVKR